jgi:hypothetical protein
MGPNSAANPSKVRTRQANLVQCPQAIATITPKTPPNMIWAEKNPEETQVQPVRISPGGAKPALETV